MVLFIGNGCAVLRIEGIELASQQREPSTLAPPLRVVWTYDAGAGFGEESAVVVGKNHIVVATRNGGLHAISVKSGRRLGFRSFGEALEAAPLIQGKMMYVPVDLGRRALYAFDLSAASSCGARRVRPCPWDCCLWRPVLCLWTRAR